MAIAYLAGNVYTGLSTDTKPTTNVMIGARFIETDTGVFFTWNGLAWLEIPLDHANIIPPNVHVAYNFTFPDSTTRIAATYAIGDIGKFIRQTDTDDIYMLTNNSPNAFVKVSGSGSGEPNTVSNVGADGVGVFKQKTGVDLEFKNINAGSAMIDVADDTTNSEIDIDLVPAAVNHDALGNLGTDNHHDMDHAARHIQGEDDEIDGDKLAIAYAPVNYTRATNPPISTELTQLTSHLKGIDNSIQSFATFQNGNKYPVRLATASALPAYTSSGTGIGKFLEANAVGALSVDGIGVVVGNRILVKNETGAAQIHNGIYIVTNPGDGTNKWVLTRVTDYDQDTEIIPGHIVQSSEGSNANTMWILTTPAPISVDSSYLIYDYATTIGITAITNIAAAANEIVDSLLLSATHSAKWIVDIYNATAGLREASEVIAREENLDCKFDQYVQVGDVINYTITFTSDGTSLQFKIENTGSNTLVVRVKRISV